MFEFSGHVTVPRHSLQQMCSTRHCDPSVALSHDSPHTPQLLAARALGTWQGLAEGQPLREQEGTRHARLLLSRLVGGIRPNTAEENVKATSSTVTKRMQRKGTGQRFSDCMGRRGVWEVELKPRGEPQKTSEGVREEQCRGPRKRQSVPGGDERG